MANVEGSKVVKCPRCGSDVTGLLRVDPGMRLRLKDAGLSETIPDAICSKCFQEFGVQLNQGAKLRAEQNLREQNRMILWRNRVNLLKEAKLRMDRRVFSEAAVLYEKYLRVVEIVYDLKPGELHPGIFSETARLRELTVITSVYWDLFRIYDSSPRYGDRQKITLQKLLAFLPRSLIQDEVATQSKIFKMTARNKPLAEELAKKAKTTKKGCFIVTASFPNPHVWEVETFYAFRDQVLLKSPAGALFVAFYYRAAPPVAWVLSRSPRLALISRRVLTVVASRLLRIFDLQRGTSRLKS